MSGGNTTILTDSSLGNDNSTPSSNLKNEMYFVLFTVTFLIWIKFLITCYILTIKSIKTRNRTKEDFKNNIQKDEEFLNADAIEDEKRWWFIELNDIENFPFHVILFWGAGIISSNDSTRLSIIILFPLYFLFRILHTVFFGLAIYSLRGLSYGLAQICVIILGVIGFVDSYRSLKL